MQQLLYGLADVAWPQCLPLFYLCLCDPLCHFLCCSFCPVSLCSLRPLAFVMLLLPSSGFHPLLFVLLLALLPSFVCSFLCLLPLWSFRAWSHHFSCPFQPSLCQLSTSGLRFSIEVEKVLLCQLHSVCSSQGGKVGETCSSLC